MNAILFDYKFNRLALFSACVSAHRWLLLFLLLFVCHVHAPIHVANVCVRECNFSALDFRYVFVFVGMCACLFFFELLFISFCQQAYTSHIFPSISVVLSTFADSHLSNFFRSLSVFAMHVTQKRRTSNEAKYVLFYFILKMGKFAIHTRIVFNKFLSLQIQMDRLKLVKPKMHECAECAPCSFGMLCPKQKKKCTGSGKRTVRVFTSTNGHFVFIDSA